MKHRKYLWLWVILVVLIGWFLFDWAKYKRNLQTKNNATNIAVAPTNAIRLQSPVTNSASNRSTIAATKINESGATEIAQKYRQGLISKEQAIQEFLLEKNKQSQDFYGKVIDQDGQPLANVSVVGKLVLNAGTYGGVNVQEYSTATDSGGLFQFIGLHGAGLGITISKPGYDNEWKNEIYKSPIGDRTRPTDRAIYRMWSTNIHEQLITGDKSFEIVPDGRPYFIDLTDGTISEHEIGDLKIWIEYTNQVVHGQLYDWSAGIEVINGGLWEVPQAAMNSGFIDQFTVPMYVAPTDGYVPSFGLKEQINVGQRGEIGNRYFYLLLNDGKEYGKMSINLFAPYNNRISGMIRLSYAVNPSGSRILR